MANLLGVIEDLDGAKTGVLRLRPFGRIYIEAGRVCWAVYPGQQHRLRQLLRHQRNPPIAPEVFEQIVRECQHTNAPFGEALVASGKITEDGLRAALLSHSTESLARIAVSQWQVERFEETVGRRFDAKFVFGTVELMTQLGAGRHLALAAVAKRILCEALAASGSGFAFVRQPGVNHPILIASANSAGASVRQARDVCTWTTSMFDLARTVDPAVYAVSGSWRGAQAVVTWEQDDVHYISLFNQRAVAALALSRVTAQRSQSGVHR